MAEVNESHDQHWVLFTCSSAIKKPRHVYLHWSPLHIHDLNIGNTIQLSRGPSDTPWTVNTTIKVTNASKYAQHFMALPLTVSEWLNF